MNINKLYVLCNECFKSNPIYACVQGGHAVAQYLLDNNDNINKWKNYIIVYLWLSEDEINTVEKTGELFGYENNISIWKEPDCNNKITSIAVYSNDIIKKTINKINKLQLVA